MVPKAESVPQERVHHALQGVATLPLIESAAGYAALPGLGAAAGVLRLVVGHIDFMADTGLQCDGDQFNDGGAVHFLARNGQQGR